MNDVLIATHDQAVHAIREHVNQPDVDELLRGVVLRVLDVHPSYPSSTGRPDPDCWACEGRGSFEAPNGDREHCHCRCPWCSGCDEPLCDGPCPTVEAIAERLDLTETPAPPMACGAFQHGQPAGMAPYRCSEPAGHPGTHRAVIDGLAVADWSPVTP